MGARLKLLVVAVGALTLLPVQAALTPMADVELRMVSGQADVGKLIYDPPPVVKLDALSQSLETAGHPVAAALVARQARFLYRLSDGCPRGAMCSM
ncbi:MAG: hypothetical protein V4457_05480 [Pseudomonadota bacterium]